MPKEINLRSPTVKRHKSQVATYGTQTPLSSTAVERGSTRWLAGSHVSIEGILDVAGTFNVSGTTVISGSLTIAGQTGITGPLTIQGVTDITGQLNVTGPTKLDGQLDIGGDTTITGLLDVQGDTTMSGKLDVTGPMATKGTLSVEGKTTLKNDLNVTSEGRVLVGDLVIDQSSPGGNIGFDGAGITSGGLGFRFTATTKDAVVESMAAGGSAKLTAGGSTVEAKAGSIDLTATRTNISGQILATGLPVTSTSSFVPNLYIDSNGRIYRTTWAPSA